MGVDELSPAYIDETPRDLTSYGPPSDLTFAVHDGSSGNTEGLYWRDRPNSRWVKVSTEPPSNSVTISLL